MLLFYAWQLEQITKESIFIPGITSPKFMIILKIVDIDDPQV